MAGLAVALGLLSHRLGDNTNDNLSLPGTDSQIRHRHPPEVVPDARQWDQPDRPARAQRQLTDSKYANAVNTAAADVAKAHNVASVNPLTSQGASALSKDQSTRYLTVGLKVSPGSLSVGDVQTIIDAAAKPAQAAGLQVETGGQLGQKVSKPSTESSELVGIIVAMGILTFTFGTVGAGGRSRGRPVGRGCDLSGCTTRADRPIIRASFPGRFRPAARTPSPSPPPIRPRSPRRRR